MLHRIHLFVAAGVIIAASLATIPLAVAQSSASEADVQPGAARVIAVKFHADWCGSCKAMGPVFEEMQAKFDLQPVLYLTFDQTRDDNRRQSAFHANALGLADVWSEFGGKTGFILLIDADSRNVVATLKHTQTLKEMGAVLLEAVESAS